MSDSLKNGSGDLLQLAPYYSGLAKFIEAADPPLTISIQGEWGSGKTATLENIENILEPQKEGGSITEFLNENNTEQKCHVIWFNTWQYSCLGINDNLTIALFTHLKSELEKLSNEEDEKDKKNKKNAERGKDHLLLKYGVKGCVKCIFDSNGLGGLFDAAAELIENIAKPNDIPQLTDEITALKAVIQKMIDEVVPDGKKLVIFIDDLDRLEPKVAVELLSGIKNILDCKKCIFVLAVDKEVIISGVKEKYGDFYNDDKKANQFFDKLIQVPFSLPTQKYVVQNLLIGKYIDDIPKAYMEDCVRVVQELFQNNPRSIERVFHSFRLHKLFYEELKIDEKRDEDIYNLFVILAFQLRDEDSYKKLVELSNNLEELSLFLKGEKNNDDIKIPIGEYLKLPDCSFSNIKIRIGNDEEQTKQAEEEQKWKELFSILRRLPAGLLDSDKHQLFFTEGMYHIIQKIRGSQKYILDINKDKCWCEFIDKKDGRVVFRFEEKGRNEKERLIVYKTKSGDVYKKVGFVEHEGKDHITILSDENNQFDKIEKFLSETMGLF